ncbi:MAG: homocysteine S-methyltransferase family protein [Anaerolineae bacterium]|nr:homocysteine S-methyltransferase family protein [Anaerolineae bacterium]
MEKRTFLERMSERGTLVLDGATGTNLQSRGLTKGLPAEVWVLEQPEKIIGLAQDFVAAGADIILTCTFGASSIRLEHTSLNGKGEMVNRRAAELAQRAVEGTPALVAGSIGPTGQLLKPLGPLDETDAIRSFAEQARYLADAGVDLLVVETQFDLAEAKAALTGIQMVTNLPVVCSFSFDRGTRTMMGVKPAQVGNEISPLGVAAIGINCGRSLEDNQKAMIELRDSTSLPIWFKPNAGLPQLDASGNPTYDISPEAMAAKVPEWISIGAKLIGGCCGTSPDHLAAIAKEVHKSQLFPSR